MLVTSKRNTARLFTTDTTVAELSLISIESQLFTLERQLNEDLMVDLIRLFVTLQKRLETSKVLLSCSDADKTCRISACFSVFTHDFTAKRAITDVCKEVKGAFKEEKDREFVAEFAKSFYLKRLFRAQPSFPFESKF